MSPRRRNKKNRDLPDNLYRQHKDSDQRWEYRNPLTRKRVFFTASKAEAIRQAKAANAKIALSTSLGDKLLGINRETLAHAIQRFRVEHLDRQKMSESHRKDWQWRLRKMEHDDIGKRVLSEIKTRDLFAWLKPIPDRSANLYRTKLVQLFDWCISVGISEWNPATPLIIRQDRKQRQALTWDDFKAIYRHANRPTRMAMALSLTTLQRRADVACMRLQDVEDGYLRVQQQKTGKRLLLPVLPDIARTIRRCKGDQVFSPYLVHQPTGNKRRQGQGLSPASISRGFQRARDASGRFDRLKEAERPTFHEILGLGEHLRREQGWSTEEIQAWRGHTTAKMTEHYMAGHEHWERVKPGGVVRK